MAWPKGKPRGPRAPKVNADPVREPVRQANRESVNPETGRMVVQGRNGEVLTRKRTVSSDIFHIPPEIVPQGYDYQWNVIEVLGRPETSAMLAMSENGWRPVPAGRHVGLFMPSGTPENAAIIRDGLRLEERPLALSDEARQEEKMKANRQLQDQKEQLGLVQRMPDGFSRDNSRLRAMEKAGTSRSYAPAPDAPRPRLEIDPAG